MLIRPATPCDAVGGVWGLSVCRGECAGPLRLPLEMFVVSATVMGNVWGFCEVSATVVGSVWGLCDCPNSRYGEAVGNKSGGVSFSLRLFQNIVWPLSTPPNAGSRRRTSSRSKISGALKKAQDKKH